MVNGILRAYPEKLKEDETKVAVYRCAGCGLPNSRSCHAHHERLRFVYLLGPFFLAGGSKITAEGAPVSNLH